MQFQQITVPVPTEKVPEFYRWFADWADGKVPVSTAHAPASPENPEDPPLSLEAATSWWQSLNSNERAIWTVWIDASPGLVTANDLVQKLNLQGPRVIPGILSWSGRKAAKVGFNVDWTFKKDPVTSEPLYGLSDVGPMSASEYAELLGRAKDRAGN